MMARKALLAALLLLAACERDNVAPPSAAAAGVPELTGLWARNTLEFEEPASGPGPIMLMIRKTDGTPSDLKVGDYSNPILQSWAAERVKSLGNLALKNIVFPDPENQCLPLPLPNILRFMQIEILQQPDHVTILYSRSGQVRQVRINDAHPTKIIPSSYGDSVGYYEGDTLVVDTVGIVG